MRGGPPTPTPPSPSTALATALTRANDGRCDTDIFTSEDQCTLRAAIQQANATTGADIINFGIPGSGVKTIDVGATGNGALPAVTEAVTIDGYSQPGARPNTLAQGDDAVSLIELNGTNAGQNANGLEILASNSLVRGLVINRFASAGIRSGFPNGSILEANRIEGNFIGTDATGTVAQGNRLGVLIVRSANSHVGGVSPAARNLISGNNQEGVEFVGVSGSNVEGNFIGTTRDGTGALGNNPQGAFNDQGVHIFGSSDVTVGGTQSGAANTIAFNGRDGVGIEGSDGNLVLGNSILSNGGLGIDLDFGSDNTVGGTDSEATNTIASNGGTGVLVNNGIGNRILGNSVFSNAALGIDLFSAADPPSGRTANDTADVDTGANDLQNFPVLSSATGFGGSTAIAGTLNSNPVETFALQFFANPPGEDEGKTFLGETTATTDASGNASFSFVAPAFVPAGSSVTATATSASGDTSEFSDATAANQLPPPHKKKHKKKKKKRRR